MLKRPTPLVRYSRPHLVIGATGVLLAAVVSAASTQQPTLAVAIVLLVAFAVWASRNPYRAACILGFLTAAFPKAGIKLAGFPFPIFLFGLLIAVVLLRVTRPHRAIDPGTIAVGLMYIAFIGVRATAASESSLATVFALFAWSLLPPLLLVLATSVGGDSTRFRKSLEAGFLVAVMYGLVQLAAGVSAVAIPGLTYAYGDDLSSKNNGLSSSVYEDFSKIPSTYQNGNIFGLVGCVFLTFAVLRLFKRQSRNLDRIMLFAAPVAILLSGSRTALIAAGLVLIIMAFRFARLSQALAVSFAAVLLTAAVLAASPGLAERFSLESLLESGGAGRADNWLSVIRHLKGTEWLLGMGTWTQQSEGWLGIIQQIGIVGVGLLLVIVVRASQSRPAIRIALFVLLIGAIFDSTYTLFPTWFVLPALAATPPLLDPEEKVPSASCYSGDLGLSSRQGSIGQ